MGWDEKIRVRKEKKYRNLYRIRLGEKSMEQPIFIEAQLTAQPNDQKLRSEIDRYP